MTPSKVALGAALFALACSASGSRASPERADPMVPTSKDYVGTPLPRGHVVLHDPYGGAHRVEVEIATDDDSRERGLMWRRSLTPGQGMLFVFPGPAEHSFWMKNTLIPLDMVFIGQDGTIRSIAENTVPESLAVIDSRVPVRATLELAAGTTARLDIRVGDKVEGAIFGPS